MTDDSDESRSMEGTPSMRLTRLRTGPWLQIGTPRRFEWNRVELLVPELPAALEGTRIVHISDLHFRQRWLKEYDEVIARLGENPPDVVVITGDFVDDKYDPRPAMPTVERFVTQLKARRGVVSILGNHDAHFLVPHLARWGVRHVGMRGVEVTMPEKTGGLKERQNPHPNPPPVSQEKEKSAAVIEFIGLEGVVRQDLDVDAIAEIPAKNEGTLRIVLSHYPDALKRIGNLSADLFLAGHTHGGQVCLPGRIPIIKHDSLPRPYCTGIHRIDNTWLVVNRGLGFATLPIRVFCPAEIIDIKVVSAER